MNLTLIKNAVTSKVGLKVLAANKNSPHILFAAGVIGVVGTAVWASKQTLQLDATLDKFDEAKARTKDARENVPEYTEKMYKHDQLVIHSTLVKDLVKLYVGPVALGVLSIGALSGSHVILTRRNAGLTATLTALTKAFDGYRARVVADQGEEKDLEYMYGVTEREVHMGETAKGEPIIEKVKSFGDGHSPYSVIFDSENLNWQTTPSYNIFFLRMVQNHLNDMLRAKGHLFLNDAYRELGFPDTEAGAVTGWIWGDGGGDQFVDFKLWADKGQEEIKAFMRGKNGELLLDFNVDGPILKKLPKGLN